MQIEEIDTTPVDQVSDLPTALAKVAAQIAAQESHIAELGDVLKRAQATATTAASTYKAQRNTKHMLEAMLRADIAADAVEAVTSAESTLQALQKRHQELTRAVYIRNTATRGGDFDPWRVMT